MLMKDYKRIDIISCPHCGAQYTAGEIYIPEYFLGKPSGIEREGATKRILQDYGRPMDTRERYICDYCNTPFNVKAFIKFNVEEDVEHNFNKDYFTSLHKNSLFLSEE